MKYLDVSATCRLVIKLVTEKLIKKIVCRAHEKINLTRNLSRKNCSIDQYYYNLKEFSITYLPTTGVFVFRGCWCSKLLTHFNICPAPIQANLRILKHLTHLANTTNTKSNCNWALVWASNHGQLSLKTVTFRKKEPFSSNFLWFFEQLFSKFCATCEQVDRTFELVNRTFDLWTGPVTCEQDLWLCITHK
jgi:hypothetical protein